MKDKSFSITDKETIAEYKAEIWRLKKELEIRDTAARVAIEQGEALQKEVDGLALLTRDLKVEVSVLKQHKSEAWTTTGLLSEQKRNDLLRDENTRLRAALERIAHWYDDGDRYFCDTTVTGFALETLADRP